MKFKHWVLAVLAVTLVAVQFSGCNTVRGVGKDIERGGEAVQKVAQ